MKRFIDMVEDVSQETQFGATPTLQSIMKRFINKRYKDVLRRINWNAVRDDYTISVVAGTRDYILPSDFGKPVFSVDTTNKLGIKHSDRLSIAQEETSLLNTTGTPSKFFIIDDRVQNQPSTAQTVTVVSSSTADTTQKVFIRVITDGYETTEQISLNGTSTVAGTNSNTRILGVSKDGDTTGKITVTNTTDGTVVAVLSPKQPVYTVKKLRFHVTPASAFTFEFPYHIKPTKLIEDDDYPVIDICDLIEIGAKADAYDYKKRSGMGTKYATLFEKGLADYVWDEINQADMAYRFAADPYSRETT